MDSQKCMENYLLILKSTIEVYVHGTLESSNEDIRNLLKDGLDETLTAQANTFELMQKYGWYSIPNVDNNIIKQAISKINQN